MKMMMMLWANCLLFAAEFFPDRTDVQCLHRWQKVLNPELIKGPWTKEEDESIVELVNRHGAKKSSAIVKNLPGRIGKQCRERRMGYGRTDLLEMDMASHQMFSTFMAKATQFEELGKLGGELLARFRQELDLFQRPPLNETSKFLANIIQSNQTERLRTYIDAGCRHFHVDAQVTIKLNDSLQGLMKHVEQAQELLKDLDCIFNKATSLMKEAASLMMQDVKISDEEHNIEDSSGTASDEGSILNDRKLELSDYVSMISVVYGMLRQDYAMQEKVVSDLQLNTPSEILQTYCFMWTLRPFVDERIVNEALVWI